MQTPDAIPLERLELLDRLTLYNGSHRGGTGGADCQHCARELLHEVITGEHADRTPPGVTVFASLLPGLNDGPWLDDDHRTAVMRPYLKKFLPPAFGGLDPKNDERRVYALVDHAYRKMLPELCEAVKLDKEAAELRALAPIVDPATARAAAEVGARDLALGLALDLARDLARALALGLDLDLARDLARALDLAGDLALARALDLARVRALDLARVRALAGDLDLARALDLARVRALDLARVRDLARALSPEERAKNWQQAACEILDLVCSIP